MTTTSGSFSHAYLTAVVVSSLADAIRVRVWIVATTTWSADDSSSTLRPSHNRLTTRRSPGIPRPCQPEPHASTACSQRSSDWTIHTIRLFSAFDLHTWVLRC